MVSDDKEKWLKRIELIEYLVGQSNLFLEEDIDDDEDEIGDIDENE